MILFKKILLISSYCFFTNAVYASSLTIDTPISGTKGIRKTGPDPLILTAVNTYTGRTDIEEGELVMSVSIPGNVVVHSGATLSGGGSIGGSVSNSGTVKADVATLGSHLTVGSYTQTSSGTLYINAGHGAFDYLNVTGLATLDGVLKINALSLAPFGNVTFKILQAGTISGRFTSIVNLGTPVSLSLASLDYTTPGEVRLTIA